MYRYNVIMHDQKPGRTILIILKLTYCNSCSATVHLMTCWAPANSQNGSILKGHGPGSDEKATLTICSQDKKVLLVFLVPVIIYFSFNV